MSELSMPRGSVGSLEGVVARLDLKSVPDANRRVAGSGGQSRPVGAEGNGMNIGPVSSQLADVFSGGDVPYPDGVVTAPCRQTACRPD